MGVRVNKEETFKINNHFNIKVGVVDKNLQNIIYIVGNTWIEPKFEDVDYSDSVYKLEKSFNYHIKQLINKSNFNTQSIYIIDIKKSGINFNKRSFIDFELHLKHNDKNFNYKDEPYRSEIINLLNTLIEKVFDLSDFKCFYKKKL